MPIYFDNAATSMLCPEVLDAMYPYFYSCYGNSSSAHTLGREAKDAIEKARKTIAELLKTSFHDIIFTSGATESNNIAILGAIETYNIKTLVTTRIEHPSVLKTIEKLENKGLVKVIYLDLNSCGLIDLRVLDKILERNPRSLVSLMHCNNELGNINDIETIGDLARFHGAIFHSDTVQSLGLYPIDLIKSNIDFAVASAHKFHGPKGVGILVKKKSHKISPVMSGGPQESRLRPGTENVPGIIGIAKALQIAYENLNHNRKYILHLKEHLINRLRERLPNFKFNGSCEFPEQSSISILNISLPDPSASFSILNYLDENGIAVSSGSACSSHDSSHVLKEIGIKNGWQNIRISLSRYNTFSEVDFLVGKLENIYKDYTLKRVLKEIEVSFD